ncbi:zf-HC2 domain-containing protein [Jeotgalibacillus proteolyticus]|uniref:Putative zinc-finger domain-containing protein n=1 Tax=Jeotgalibacillus proteolyticus TaxID=2082395 RepID=A0A2S5G8Y9_9BACL|nr:zf-HC2 domain-containing protein [Jeotgalibacillus proteolyticus]PPA69405.1 hypothetical protein C4B60_16590 [Jeotgalibacillus proteolyticus]
MKEIKCTVIQDVLPLYVDEVVSLDTKEMVDEHLQHCEKCQKEYEAMKGTLYIPAQNEAPLINKINKKWRRKKVIVSIASVLATAIVLFGAFAYVFYFERVIPYSDDLFEIGLEDNNQLVSQYYGKSYATVHETHPMRLEIDGETRNVSFIYYTKTIADSPSRSLLNREKNDNEQDYSWTFAESEKIDAVYYAEFDVYKITDGKDSWEAVLDRGELVWER